MSALSRAQLEDLLKVEYWRCRTDPMYWLDNWGCMKDETSGSVLGPGIPLWPDQIPIVAGAVKGEWQIHLKSRKVGVSWIFRNYEAHQLLFRKNIGLSIVAQGDEYAQEHRSWVKWVYEQQPAFLRVRKPLRGRDNTSEFALGNLSDYALLTSYPCTGNALRGPGRAWVCAEELAFWPNAEIVWPSVIGAASRPGAQVIAVSTANGVGNLYHQLWTKATRKKTVTSGAAFPFVPYFTGWRADPSRTQEWRDRQTELLGEVKAKQEFPDNPEEAFASTNASYFDQALLSWLFDQYKQEPIDRNIRGCLDIFVAPEPGRTYTIGADVADGGGDACSADVLDDETGEQVAHYHSYEASADEFGDHLMAIASVYNNALLAIERNNNGVAAITVVLRANYRPLYTHQHFDPGRAQAMPRVGWITDASSRPVMLSQLAVALKDPNAIRVHASETYRQLVVFGYYKNKWQAPPTDHDDAVISLAIANAVRLQKLAGMGRERMPNVYLPGA